MGRLTELSNTRADGFMASAFAYAYDASGQVVREEAEDEGGRTVTGVSPRSPGRIIESTKPPAVPGRME